MAAASCPPLPAYAELHCISNFTFLRGASHPAELVEQAAALGYSALALTDECSVAGLVRAHVAARQHGLKLIVGSEFCLADGLRLVCLAANREAYAALCALITRGRRAAAKGSYHLERSDFQQMGAGCLVLWIPPPIPDPADARWLTAHFPGRAWLAVELHADGDEQTRRDGLLAFALGVGLPVVAAGDVHMHVRRRRALQDTLTAIRRSVPLHQEPDRLHANGERHLRSRAVLARCYPAPLLTATLEIAGRIAFSLDELRYQYPPELVPAGYSPAAYLRLRTLQGMGRRWPGGAPDDVRQQVKHELRLIGELGYEHYFLTVDDIVRFANSQGILCQGRGSAANSLVCYCLGITAVGPEQLSLLFERFISRERNEPPDIDVDFEHERRDEVIQYIYAKYGRERAALTATVIKYRPRSAIRDVGRALGYTEGQVNAMAKSQQWWDDGATLPERMREAGLDPELDPEGARLRRLCVLVGELIHFPRHLSQHVGGFVISGEPLSRLVPVENAAMPERTVIQWDKDDLDELGILKVDVLSLGMLSAIRRSFDLIHSYSGERLSLGEIRREDPAVYDMLSRGDSVGVFQVESRAQMSMLPRLQPRNYYDLVVQVAIVRPGPIQGGMVHPYLQNRQLRAEDIAYPSPEVRKVLERTLGVPIFQEQVMRLAVVAAGFTPGEADQLRRTMASWRRQGDMHRFEEKLLEGMRARRYSDDFAWRIIRQIRGFGEYGFPESHAASFALLVYASAWLKCHEPAAFTAALLNSQPMGFYAPAQLIQSARRSGVEVRPPEVNRSDWDCTLEPHAAGQPALRLGLRLVHGLSKADAEPLVQARAGQDFASVQDLRARSGLGRRVLALLAAAGALERLAGHRHRAHWQAAGVEGPGPLLPVFDAAEGIPLLRSPTEAKDITADYASLGLTLRRHPLALLRARPELQGVLTAGTLWGIADGSWVRVAGLVVGRQRPATANGVIFVTLEDETGSVNLIVRPKVVERQRRALLGSRLLMVWGQLQCRGDVVHVVVSRMEDHSALLGNLLVRSRDFH